MHYQYYSQKNLILPCPTCPRKSPALPHFFCRFHLLTSTSGPLHSIAILFMLPILALPIKQVLISKGNETHKCGDHLRPLLYFIHAKWETINQSLHQTFLNLSHYSTSIVVQLSTFQHQTNTISDTLPTSSEKEYKAAGRKLFNSKARYLEKIKICRQSSKIFLRTISMNTRC